MKVCTLMYHDVYRDDKKESGINIDSALSYKISAELFEKQIKALRDYIDAHQLDESLIRLSFDDGGESFYTIIAPILEKYGFKGYFFVVTSFLNKDGFLSNEQLVELYRRGHIIGSHSHTHRQMMTSLSREELWNDWKSSLEYLNNLLNCTIAVASLPNGFCSPTLFDVLNELGVKEVYTSQPTDNVQERGGQMIYGRWGIKDGMNKNVVLQIAFSPFKKCVIRCKKAMLNAAKTILGHQYIKIREFLYKN